MYSLFSPSGSWPLWFTILLGSIHSFLRHAFSLPVKKFLDSMEDGELYFMWNYLIRYVSEIVYVKMEPDFWMSRFKFYLYFRLIASLAKTICLNAVLYWSKHGAFMKVVFLVLIMAWSRHMLWKRWCYTSSITSTQH